MEKKKCKKCGVVKQFQQFILQKKKFDTCNLCRKPTKPCPVCSKETPATSKCCKSCYAQLNKLCALTGHEKPAGWDVCPVCGISIPWFTSLGHQKTCEWFCASSCGAKLRGKGKPENANKTISLQAKKNTRHALCLKHPQCAEYGDCLMDNFKKHDGKCRVEPRINYGNSQGINPAKYL